MQSTSHKYHAFRPGNDHRQNLHIYHPAIHDLVYETEENYNQFNSTIVENEQFKTSSGTIYKGRQLPTKEAVELQGFKKAPFHGYINYVNDNEVSKINFPSAAPNPARLLRSTTHYAFSHPKSKTHPDFTEIISAPKDSSERMPFAANSVTKTDYRKHTGGHLKPSPVLSEPITRQNMPPSRRVLTKNPSSFKNYNLTSNPVKDTQGRFKTSTGSAHAWPIQKLNEVGDGRALKISSFFGNSTWGTNDMMNRDTTSYSVHGQARLGGVGKKYADLYN